MATVTHYHVVVTTRANRGLFPAGLSAIGPILPFRGGWALIAKIDPFLMLAHVDPPLCSVTNNLRQRILLIHPFGYFFIEAIRLQKICLTNRNTCLYLIYEVTWMKAPAGFNHAVAAAARRHGCEHVAVRKGERQRQA